MSDTSREEETRSGESFEDIYEALFRKTLFMKAKIAFEEGRIDAVHEAVARALDALEKDHDWGLPRESHFSKVRVSHFFPGEEEALEGFEEVIREVYKDATRGVYYIEGSPGLLLTVIRESSHDPLKEGEKGASREQSLARVYSSTLLEGGSAEEAEESDTASMELYLDEACTYIERSARVIEETCASLDRIRDLSEEISKAYQAEA